MEKPGKLMPVKQSAQYIPRRTFLGGLGAVVGSTLLQPGCGPGEAGSLLDVDEGALVSSADLIYLSPAAEPVEGHPIGNGRMGTMIWTEPDRVRMQINRNDVFAVNRNHEGPRDGPADHCGGCAQVSIDVGADAFSGERGFEQRLSLYRAEDAIEGGNLTVRCFAAADTDVLVAEIDDRRPQPQPIRVALSMWREPEVKTGAHTSRYEFEQAAGEVSVAQQFSEADHFCSSAVAVRAVGREVSVESDGGKSRVLAMPAAKGKVTVYISSAAAWQRETDVRSQAIRLLAETVGVPLAELLARHRAWWEDFWSRSFVSVSSRDGIGEFISRIRMYHLYCMASTSRGPLPAKWNASLFAVDGDRRRWGAQFWVWTTEISHFPLFASNSIDLTVPFFDMYVRQIPACEIAARQRWNASGAYFLEAGPFDGPVELPGEVASEYFDVYQGIKPNTGFSERARSFGQYECVLTQMADDRKPPSIAKGRYSWVSHIASSGSEIAVAAWWRYRYSGDEEWLRTHAYPLLKTTLEFYRSLAKKEDDGLYHLYGLNQHEAFWGVDDGNVDLAAIRGTAPLAIRAAEILDLDAELREKWRELLDHLAPFPMGRDPKSKALAGGTIADDVWSIGHLGQVPGRHMDPGEALLFPVFPFEVWTLETEDAETTRIALKISELNPSSRQIFEGEPFGSAARTPIMESRAGRGGDLPLLLASYYRNCFSPLPNGFSNFEGVTAHSIEHLGCITTALQEGLMQSISPRPAEPEVIRVAPTWPDEWDAAFRLLARGGFLVAAVIEAGRPRFIEIEARLGGECRVRNPWGGKCAVMRRNELIVESDGDVIRFAAEKGARYLLLPEGEAPPGPIAVSAQRSAQPFSCSFELPNGKASEAVFGRMTS